MNEMSFADVVFTWHREFASISIFLYSMLNMGGNKSAFPKSDGNLFEWVGTIEGPPETVRFLVWIRVWVFT